MESSTNDTFEQFLQENAEQFRMVPSDRVWEGISKNINKRKRKYFFFGLATLLTVTSSLGYLILNAPAPNAIRNITADKTSPSVNKNSIGSQYNSITDSFERSRLIAETESRVTEPPKKAKVIPINVAARNAAEEKKTASGVINVEVVEPKEKWSANTIEAEKASAIVKSIDEAKISLLNELAVAAETPADKANEKKKAKAKLRKSKFSMMAYFTPTISYRKLSENKSYLRSSPVGAPYSYAALYDVNNAVTHKPDIGLEFGLTGKYAITKNVKLRAGVQFNINRYDIKAFGYFPEMATIALNSRGYRVDSLSTISNYRNFNGGKPHWLQNFYFQVSAPVGLEAKLRGNDKTYFGVAGTVQPTYLIGDRAYMITADYKNYAQVPWLIRRWNVNTNLETFVAYSTGKVKWQVGPQIRYQLLSSFVSEYPVKENLFDFGLKVGISLNQNQ